MIVKYSSNNSGGQWWLEHKDWKALEKAGWKVDWEKNGFLGALAHRAERHGLSLEDAVSEFERITGQDSEANGCDCCGRPHIFYVRE